MVGQAILLLLRCSHLTGEPDNNKKKNQLPKKSNFQVLLKYSEGNKYRGIIKQQQKNFFTQGCQRRLLSDSNM